MVGWTRSLTGMANLLEKECGRYWDVTEYIGSAESYARLYERFKRIFYDMEISGIYIFSPKRRDKYTVAIGIEGGKEKIHLDTNERIALIEIRRRERNPSIPFVVGYIVKDTGETKRIPWLAKPMGIQAYEVPDCWIFILGGSKYRVEFAIESREEYQWSQRDEW